MSIRKVALTLLISFFSYSVSFADELALNPNHPERYVVVKGDTLWDISAKFLRDPWRWPEIWRINPEIANPHLIYPGDVILFSYQDGKPVLTVQRGRAAVKLTPQMRKTRIDSAIPSVPAAAVSQFISQPRIFTKEELNTLGYIISAEDERLIVGSGTKIYVRNLEMGESKDYSIFHIGEAYIHPETKEILGYEAKHVADAQLVAEGDPSTLVISHAHRETLIGDKVILTDEDASQQNFIPHAPEMSVKGKIVSIFEGVSRGGLYHSVVVDLGAKDGIEKGHVLSVQKQGIKIRDYLAKSRGERWVTTPSEEAALIMIFRVFDNISYGLVMNAVKDVRALDIVTSP